MLKFSQQLLLLQVLLLCAAANRISTVPCDIVIAGGSTASLAAGIAAAEVQQSQGGNATICLLDIQDWLGGQLTSSCVSAIDYSKESHLEINNGRAFRDLMEWTKREGSNSCWVSYNCFLPNDLIDGWINPLIARLERTAHLKVFLRTVVTSTSRNASTGAITALQAIQRFPSAKSSEWDAPLSETVEDWYEPEPSARFPEKHLLEFVGTGGRDPVFVEATEFGDVLGASDGLPFTQGYEYPSETSTTSQSSCGLASTLVFFTEILQRNKSVVYPKSRGGDAGEPFPRKKFVDNAPWWNETWTYRRGVCNGSTSMTSVNVGDVTQQNLVNDLDTAYLFDRDVNSSAPTRPWRGGLNRTALAMGEARARGTFYFLQEMCWGSFDFEFCMKQFSLSLAASGTSTGLCKLPYLRDTRRAFGIDNFRFLYEDEVYYNASNPFVGRQFSDTVALGSYLYCDLHRLTFCQLPAYCKRNETRPFQIPFRALTVGGAPNLLVAGKTMSQSFHANGATRVHPVEWSTGTAAGVAAYLMSTLGANTSEIYAKHITKLQALLRSPAIDQPLEWTIPQKPEAALNGTACLFNRCVLLDSRAASSASVPVYNGTTCEQHCSPLKPDEWIAPDGSWSLCTDDASFVCPSGPAHLTKGACNWVVLPPSKQIPVSSTTRCRLVAPKPIPGVGYLCSLSL